MSFNEKMTAIADTIRNFGGATGKIGLDDMPKGIGEVWNDGYINGEQVGIADGYWYGWEEGWDEGYMEGEAFGIECGKQAEYDRFWTNFLDGRELHRCLFSGYGWNAETCRPPAPIKPRFATRMFYMSSVPNVTADIVDWSECEEYNYCFAESQTETINTLDFSKATKETSLTGVCYYATAVHTIEKVILKDDGTTPLVSSTFGLMNALQNISFEGTIGRDLNMQWSPLTVESMLSIITHLKKYKNTEYEGLYTLTFSEDCWNRLEAWKDEQEQGSGWSEWGPSMKYYVQYKMGWAIG